MSTEQIETQSQPEAMEQVADQAVETVSPDNSETATEIEGGENSQPEERQHKQNGTQKRIGKLVGKIGHLGRENEQLRAELEQMRGKVNSLTPPNTKPDIADPKWKTIDDYNDALINWHQRQQRQTTQAQQPEQANNQQPNNDNAHTTKWATEFAEFAKAEPEINKLSKEDVAWFIQDLPEIGAIIDQSYNPALVLHFAKNPELVYDLEGLNPIQLAFEIGKIEASLTRKTPVKQTTKTTIAQPPINPVKGNAAPIAFDYEKASAEDFIKKRNEEERQRKLNRG